MDQSRKLRVAVLFGGRSAEHEISLLSARFVVESLDPERFEPILVGIDRTGHWLLQERAWLANLGSDPRQIQLQRPAPAAYLPPHADAPGEYALRVDGQASLPVDVVFPMLHGPLGEDGATQGLLELSGVPYVGAAVLGSAVGMDKDVMKRLLAQAKLPIVPHAVVRRAEWQKSPAEVIERVRSFGLPLFVKPANLGSSVGVERIVDRSALGAAVIRAFAFDDKLVIERGHDHPREIECAVLGGAVPRASIPGEIRIHHPDGFYSYAAKYLDPTAATLTIPADLSSSQTERVRALAISAFQVLECEGLARVDLFLDRGGELYLNEINTLPGFTAISMFPKLWAASGVPARELMSLLIDDARARATRKQARRTSM